MQCDNFSKQKQYCLVIGYIRTTNTAYIPHEIMNLFCVFFYFNNVEQYIQTLKKCEYISSTDISRLCVEVKSILMEESNIMRIDVTENDKLIIVGDIQGQFFDLKICIFDKFGYPNNSCTSPRYLFLGAYTNKYGAFNTETLLLLLSLQAYYPSKITLLRGHIECESAARYNGLFNDLKIKYGKHDAEHILKTLTEVFCCLPLCSIINNKIFCVHGGLSPSINTLDQIELINRFREPPNDGPLSDLLWSMPMENHLTGPWGITSRGAGYTFDESVVDTFFALNNIDLMIHSSMLILQGYLYRFNDKVLTIQSAPNIARNANLGGVAIIDKLSNVKIETYFAAPDQCRHHVSKKVPAFLR